MSQNTLKGRFRPKNGKRIVVSHEFHGERTVTEALAPMVASELERLRTESAEQPQQPDHSVEEPE